MGSSCHNQPVLDPCAYSPNSRQARHSARAFAQMFAPGSVLVDVGFGQGYFLEAAREAGHSALGIDRDERLVESANARGLHAVVASVDQLDAVLGNAVDGIMASHIIEHLTPDAVTQLFIDMANIVRPDGVVVLVTPNMGDWRVASEWFWTDPTHIRPYPSGAVRQIVDPDHWTWDADGLEPMVFTRRTPVEWLQRVRFGREYGRPGRWYRLRRR